MVVSQITGADTRAAPQLIDKDRSTIRVIINVSRTWNFRPGRYVYLSIPRLSHYYFFQSHPFMASWWEDDEDNHCIALLVQVRSGFTKDLLFHATTNQSELLALVEGPYGQEIPLHEYGTALLFATGIGIAGQLPYVRHILEEYRRGKAKTQKVVLFWELESGGE